jgi:ribosomal protein S6--L-glutamate ligase
VRIAFLAGRYAPTDRSCMPQVARWLADWGATVEWIHVAERLIDLTEVRVEHDLYVLKDKSDLALSVAACLHAAGAAILNPYPASAMLRDKIVTSHVLQAAGVPAPRTFVASHVEQLRPALEQGPLIVKPYRGSRGVGVRLVRDAAELAALSPIEEPVFAQSYHAPEGRDRKLYAIGEELYGVMRVWPPRTYQDKLGEPFTPSPDVADIARRCGAAFGIDLFGVDIVESDGAPYVVDMSSLPGFKGVPDAARRVAAYVHAAAQRATLGDPIVPPASGAPAFAERSFQGSTLELVLHALSTTPATSEELDQIRKLLDAKQGK